MKIEQIKIENVQGIRNIDLRLTAPVAFITGKNGAGKSSIRDAVAMALTGQPTRVSLKKDYAQLVNDQAGDGFAEVICGDDTYAICLPSGKGSHVANAEMMTYLLDSKLFVDVDSDTKRNVLFSLTGCKVGTAEVRKRLEEKKADSEKAEKVLPLLRAGFPAAEKEAKSKATEAKGAWRAITGETYGEKKAEGWAATKPENTVDESTAVRLEEVEKELTELTQQIGNLSAQSAMAESRAHRLNGLREKAGRYARIHDKLNLDEAALKEWEEKVASTQALASGTKVVRVGLVHTLANALHWLVDEQQPLGIDRDNYQRGLLALDAYENEHGPIDRPGDKAPDPEATAKLAEHIKARDLMLRSVENGKRDLEEADNAAKQIKGIEDEATENPFNPAELEKITEKRDALRLEKKALADKVSADRQTLEAINSADKKTSDAAGHHADVLAWGLIADALAPDGIPSEILNDALAPVNAQLKSLSSLAKWPVVAIDKDMQITANARAYGLLSESEKWRVECLLTLVIAKFSKLKLVMLDRFDVLDMDGRRDLIVLLDELAYSHEIETAIVCGTLKKAPNLPDTMQAFWVEAGECVEHKQEAVAA